MVDIDYYSESFNMDGDLLDDVLIDEFGLSPKYSAYWVLRKLVLFSYDKEVKIPIEDVVRLYSEKNDVVYETIFRSLERLFTTSTKRMIKKGNVSNSYNMLVERYKAKVKKGN